MNRTNIHDWITILRSGNYKQIFNDWGDNVTSEKCAIGVACHYFNLTFDFEDAARFFQLSSKTLIAIADYNDDLWTFEQISNLLMALIEDEVEERFIDCYIEYKDFERERRIGEKYKEMFVSGVTKKPELVLQ